MKNDMKYLKIENNQGFYYDGKKCQEIDKINKDDLLKLLNVAENNEFEMDPYDEKLLKNKAHQIIYENIFLKINQFLNEKYQFKTEVDNLYKEAVEKYSADIQNEKLDNTDGLDNENDLAGAS